MTILIDGYAEDQKIKMVITGTCVRDIFEQLIVQYGEQKIKQILKEASKNLK
jgi:UDP-N-acetylglucosamine transferase subunit ALG13